MLLHLHCVQEWLQQQPPSHVLAAVTALAVVCIGLLYRHAFGVPAAEEPVHFPWSPPESALSAWTGQQLESPTLQPSQCDAPHPPACPDHEIDEHVVCWDPSTAYYLGTRKATLPNEIDGMIVKATTAQQQWRDTSWTLRRKVLRSLLRWVVTDMDAIARVACRDTGKTMIDAAFGEVLTTAEKLRWLIANGESILAPESRSTNLLLAHKVSKVHYEPLGVVLAIVSWNYPAHNLLSPIIAALTSGNAIIVKPSEHVLYSSYSYLDAIHSCLQACGITYAESLVQIAACLPAGSSYLAGAKGISHVTFIGSEEVGKKVGMRAAEAGIPVCMELGGKDPAIILPDADLNFFCNTFMRAAFQGAGQNCIGIERFVVSAEIYDKFVEMVTPRVKALEVGSLLAKRDSAHVDVGAMLSSRPFKTLTHLLNDAKKRGAKVLVGGKRWEGPGPDGKTIGRGCTFWEPTLVMDVTPDMAIAQDELFAPVMLVMKSSSVDESIAMANGTRYGLGAAVFGRNKARCRYVASRLQCGMVAINDFGVFYLNQSLPFGGAKSSGYSRFGGPEGLRGLCSLKAITEDRLHGIIQTPIPPLLAYPLNQPKAGWQFVTGLVGLAYGNGLRERIQGLWSLATAK